MSSAYILKIIMYYRALRARGLLSVTALRATSLVQSSAVHRSTGRPRNFFPRKLATQANKMGDTTIAITGFATCSYFQKAKRALVGIQELVPGIKVEVIEHPDRDAFRAWWFPKRETLGPRAAAHGSSPAVWLNGTDFLGGCDATLDWVKQSFMAGSSISRPPRVVHENDLRTPNDGEGYQYDLVVIGGGSGGLACSKEAAALGARVAVLDFVKPSWAGSSWGLGGTCVNVGCIPKKLMHNAALLGEALHADAPAYGWVLPGEGAAGLKHDWSKLVSSVQDHIAGLNFGYRVSLREKGVEYKNALGSFKDAHTIECVDKKGKRTDITARRIVIAVGGRPKSLDIPGGDLAISSDDIFSLDRAPGKTLVIGASYVALECAGFLRGLGYDVSVMVRSILLRGFDQQCADAIGKHMEAQGVAFIRPAVPTAIEKQADGRLKVTWMNADSGSSASETYDTVFAATGRTADTSKLNLGAAGVAVDKDGKIPVVGEQTSVPHVYAIGDVISGGLELTPVAIMAGRLLARRLYGGSTQGMDYDKVPTAVFTPLEFGNCGLSEEAATAKFGADAIDVYHSAMTPLEWSVVEARPQNACYAKIVVHKADANRIVGFQLLGPNAGEVTQGWACALRLGATYESFTQTVGIHPTVAEEFTTLAVTKASGESADKGGC